MHNTRHSTWVALKFLADLGWEKSQYDWIYGISHPESTEIVIINRLSVYLGTSRSFIFNFSFLNHIFGTLPVNKFAPFFSSYCSIFHYENYKNIDIRIKRAVDQTRTNLTTARRDWDQFDVVLDKAAEEPIKDGRYKEIANWYAFQKPT